MSNLAMIDYVLYNADEKVLASGCCQANPTEQGLSDICAHAGVKIDDVAVFATTVDK